MLAADKLQLQSALKQQATALKEKEFNLHHSNMMTVGTQAAVLAGLDITMFIEFNPPANEEWGDEPYMWMIPRILKFFYYIIIVSAFCANIFVVSQTTTLSVLGAGLALRGPDGSMMTATDGLYEERKMVFFVFGIGLACTIGSVVVIVWIILHWECAFFCFLLALMTARSIWKSYLRVQKRFAYDESDTVDFRDIMEGPAAIMAVPWARKKDRLQPQNGYDNRHRPPTVNGGLHQSRSMPLDIEDGDGDGDDWPSQPLVRREYDVKKRPSKSPDQEVHNIQTV